MIGRNGPSLATGVTLGVRFKEFFLIGVAYDFHMLSPRWGFGAAPASSEEQLYQSTHLHNIFGVLRLIIPVKRVDIGLEAAPGYAFNFFNAAGDGVTRQLPETAGLTTYTREFSRGFALKLAPVFSVFVSKHAYLGVRGDVLLGIHPESCYKDAATLRNVCISTSFVDQDRRAPIHNLGIKALIGAVF